MDRLSPPFGISPSAGYCGNTDMFVKLPAYRRAHGTGKTLPAKDLLLQDGFFLLFLNRKKQVSILGGPEGYTNRTKDYVLFIGRPLFHFMVQFTEGCQLEVEEVHF